MGAVVLLHALGVGAGMWSAQARTLTAAGHQVFAPDQRGYGDVPLGDDPPSLDLVADDVVRGLDRAGVDRAVVAGSSMGGYVAMALLRRHPDRLAGLVLSATRATADSPAVAAGRAELAVRIVDPRLDVLARFVPPLLGASSRPRLLATVRSMVAGVPRATLAWSVRAVACRPDSVDLLRAASVPAVVIAGAQDELVAADETRELAALLGGASPLTVPDAGHLTPLEAPDVVTGVLAAVLAAV